MSKAVPLIPETAPYSAEQRAWLNGFFAGLFSRAPGAPALPSAGSNAPFAGAKPIVPLTILFGSQTGTAEGLAKRAAKEAGKRGFAAMILDMAQIDAAKLTAEKNVLLITSTYGDGEPPDNAKALHDALASGVNLELPQLRFSVCALGDTNYTQFCKCGADFDAYLKKLGATRIAPRVDCDLDYEENFSRWLNAALLGLASAGEAPRAFGETAHLQSGVSDLPQSNTRVGQADAAVPALPNRNAAPGTLEATQPVADPAAYSRARPFPASLLVSRRLNAPGSAKQVHHIEFDLTDSGLSYEAGDALGVLPQNCPALVSDVLAALGCDGEEAVPAPDGSTTSLRHALTELYDLGRPAQKLLDRLAPGAGAGTGAALHHVIDVLAARADIKLSPTEFVAALKKLQPRLYSISSSPRAHAGQVHLTVGVVRYDLHGRMRKGVCSTYLAVRAEPGQTRVGVFIHPNKAFRPPISSDTPAIMIGPGTGIAPFRGFLHERRAAGANGRNWLFFGDQSAATDFLYRDELAVLMREGALTRLDTAFSRDQPQKIYVQHRMLEHATEFYQWLEEGAHVYVCGDASRMAKDVDAALHAVIERAGGKTPEQAIAYIHSLKAAKRYARDVY
jgi:sulfite reductase (NADPH) flavoprotein alpha-component